MRSTHRADRVGPAVYYPQLNRGCRRKGPIFVSPDRDIQPDKIGEPGHTVGVRDFQPGTEVVPERNSEF